MFSSDLRVSGSVVGSSLVGLLEPSVHITDLRAFELSAEELEMPLEYCPSLVLYDDDCGVS